MKIIHKNQTKEFRNNDVCTAFEYFLNDPQISSAVIELKGRYPEKGMVTNLECKELTYVVKGSGKLVVEDKEFSLIEGDVALIEPKEKFFWDGDMVLFMPCTPAWNPNQHKEIK